MAATDVTFRVYRVPRQLKNQVAKYRETNGIRQQDLIDQAINEKIEAIVAALAAVSIEAPKQKVPARWPMTERNLKMLRAASAKTGIPASTLLLACVSEATGEEEPRGTKRKADVRRKRRGSQSTAKAGADQGKAARRTRKRTR